MPGGVIIERRFRGPQESGNGGYSCGMLARSLDAPQAEVTLRLPPPLERVMEVAADDGRFSMRDGEAVVAEAEPVGELGLEVPEPIGVGEARAAMAASPLYEEHPFPECFVCGPHRHRRDGLCVVCGPIGPELVAAPWEVDDTVVDEDGLARPEIVWAALDCPGGLAGMRRPDLGVCVLGRLAARIHAAIPEGMTCVAIGWPIDRDGRKIHAGSAIFSEDGELLAEARATWIELKG
jgi:hypothetical protein